MAKKTWKIGECARGGVITVETTTNSVTIIGKEWDSSAGSGRGSSQVNAKEFTRKTVKVDEEYAFKTLAFFLQDLTTPYYADEIMDWVQDKVKISVPFFW